MKTIVIIILVLISYHPTKAQLRVEGEGFILQGIVKDEHGSFKSLYLIIMPSNINESRLWDSLFSQVLSKGINHYFNGGNCDSSFLNCIKGTYKHPILLRKGFSINDSFFKSNRIEYDKNKCYMRSNRPFFTMLPYDSMVNLKFVIHIDKIRYQGKMLKLSSIDEYRELMCYVPQDKNNKISVMTMGGVILTDLSEEYMKYEKEPIVFVPEVIKTFDPLYYKIEPSCFINKEK